MTGNRGLVRVALCLCLAGLTGCSSSGGGGGGAAGGPTGNVFAGSPSASPSCFTTAYVRGKPPAVVLVSAQLPDLDIPDPDIYIDSERDAAPDQETWADTGKDNALKEESAYPLEDGLQPTNANLTQESRAVEGDEDAALLTDDIEHLGNDPDYGDQVCRALAFASSIIGTGTINPNDPVAVADAIMTLKSASDPYAPYDLGGAIKDAWDKFEAAFPQCHSVLDTVQWIIGQLQKLFCGSG